MSGGWAAAVAVFVGSGVGGVLRYGVALASKAWAGALASPWSELAATWAVNFLGSAVLAAMVARGHRGAWASEPTTLLLTTGLMGGFTTYSTFNTEMIALWTSGRGAEAVAYLLATVAGCLVGGWLGWMAGASSA